MFRFDTWCSLRGVAEKRRANFMGLLTHVSPRGVPEILASSAHPFSIHSSVNEPLVYVGIDLSFQAI